MVTVEWIGSNLLRCPEASSLLSVVHNESLSRLTYPMIFLPLVLIWSRAPLSFGRRSKAAILVAFVFAVTTLSLQDPLPGLDVQAAAADTWDSETAADSNDPVDSTSRPRLREGTRLGSSVGKFSRSGRRWVFDQDLPDVTNDSADGLAAKVPTTERKVSKAGSPTQPTMRYQVLENLALQRVADAIAQDPNDIRWTVTGAITEFSGENWLLLSTVIRAPAKKDAVVIPIPAP